MYLSINYKYLSLIDKERQTLKIGTYVSILFYFLSIFFFSPRSLKLLFETEEEKDRREYGNGHERKKSRLPITTESK